MKNSGEISLKFGKTILLVWLLLVIPSIGFAQKPRGEKKKQQVEYRYNQYVMVTLKDGTEVPAKVTSVKSKTQCYVKMIGGQKTGAVSKKYIRPMTKDEIEELKKSIKKE